MLNCSSVSLMSQSLSTKCYFFDRYCHHYCYHYRYSIRRIVVFINQLIRFPLQGSGDADRFITVSTITANII